MTDYEEIVRLRDVLREKDAEVAQTLTRAEQAEAALVAREKKLRALVEQWRAVVILRRRDESRLSRDNEALADLLHEQGHSISRCAEELDSLLEMTHGRA